MTIEQRAREMLAAELGWTPSDIINLVGFMADRPEVPVLKAAIRTIAKALTATSDAWRDAADAIESGVHLEGGEK